MVTVVTKTQSLLIVQIHSIFEWILFKLYTYNSVTSNSAILPQSNCDFVFWRSILCERNFQNIFLSAIHKLFWLFFLQLSQKPQFMLLSEAQTLASRKQTHFDARDKGWQKNHHLYLFVHCSVHQAFMVTSYWRHFLYKYEQFYVR